MYATGLVAGGALVGMLLGFFSGFFPAAAKWIAIGHKYWESIEPFGNYISLLVFFLLGMSLYYYARKDH